MNAENRVNTEIAKSNLTERVKKVLQEQIVHGEFALGQKLPTGQDLARRFGVSVTVIREAISSLKAEGLVETRQGAGAFVSRSAHLRPFRIELTPATGISASEQIFELRMGVEMQAAAFAAKRGSDEQLAAIREALSDMEAALQRGEDGVEEDIRFHRRIAEAAQNPLFSDFLDFLGKHIRDSIQVSRQSESAWGDESRKVMQEHHAIADAILHRDPEAARAAAYLHMANCMRRCSQH